MSVFTILYRNVKWRFHNAFTIVITILQPALWLVLYSTVAGQAMKGAGIENYTAFILPGLVVLISFSVSSSSGIMNYIMKSGGSYYRVLIAPVKRSAIVLGQLLEASLCTFFEVCIMIIVSMLLSVRIYTNLSGIFFIIVLVFLTSFFMAGLSFSISLILPNEVIYETLMNAIVLPVFFLSSALFPTDNISGVLKAAVRLNPFTHVIDALRSIILSGGIEPAAMIRVSMLLVILGAVSFMWALYNLKRETNQ